MGLSRLVLLKIRARKIRVLINRVRKMRARKIRVRINRAQSNSRQLINIDFNNMYYYKMLNDYLKLALAP